MILRLCGHVETNKPWIGVILRLCGHVETNKPWIGVI